MTDRREHGHGRARMDRTFPHTKGAQWLDDAAQPAVPKAGSETNVASTGCHTGFDILAEWETSSATAGSAPSTSEPTSRPMPSPPGVSGSGLTGPADRDLDAAGVGFRSLTEGIDTTTPAGLLVFHIFRALAQFEAALISERTTAGLAATRARGRSGGRPRAMTPEKLAVATTLSTGRRSIWANWPRPATPTKPPFGTPSWPKPRPSPPGQQHQ